MHASPSSSDKAAQRGLGPIQDDAEALRVGVVAGQRGQVTCLGREDAEGAHDVGVWRDDVGHKLVAVLVLQLLHAGLVQIVQHL